MLIIFITLYITSLVLIYLTIGRFYLLITFNQFPLLPPPASGNYKSDLFSYEFVCFLKRNWFTTLWYFPVSNIGIQYFYTLQNDHHSEYTEHCHQKYYTSIDYIPHSVQFIPVKYLFCNWNLVPVNFPHLFHSYSLTYFTHCLSGNQPVSFVCLWLFHFVCSFALLLDARYNWNHMEVVFLWLISLSVTHLSSSVLSQITRFHFISWLSNTYLWALSLLLYIGYGE